MSASRWLACAAFSVFCVLKVSSLDTFVAAVYEHAVILPSNTLLPVSPSEALALMNQNLDLLEGAIVSAAKQVWAPISPECQALRRMGAGECMGGVGGGSQGPGCCQSRLRLQYWHSKTLCFIRFFSPQNY